MEMHGVIKDVLIELFKLKKEFKTKFETKSFIVGVSQLIVSASESDNLKDAVTISKFIVEALEMLKKIQKKEVKDAQKKVTSQLEEESDYTEDDYSSEDDDTESEEEKDG